MKTIYDFTKDDVIIKIDPSKIKWKINTVESLKLRIPKPKIFRLINGDVGNYINEGITYLYNENKKVGRNK